MIDEILNDIVEMLLKKNAAYGGANIVFTGLLGIATRLVDKVYRLHNLVLGGGQHNFESVEDTLRDIIGYCAIGHCLYAKRWGTKADPMCLRNFMTEVKEYINPIGKTVSTLPACTMELYLSGQNFFKDVHHWGEVTPIHGDVVRMAHLALTGLVDLKREQLIREQAEEDIG